MSPFLPEGKLEAKLRRLLCWDLELYEFAKTLVGASMTVPESPRTPDLSVVFGTYNRIWHLTRCIASMRKAMGGLSYELVVCDAGSTDGSREWLAAQPDVVLVGERVREGAVKAFNKGFHISRGHAIAYWNDDVVAVDKDAMVRAVEMLYEPGVGQVACPFNVRDNTNMSLEHVHGKPFANLGIITRTLANAIIEITGGLWSPCYHTYGADTELSCWVHKLGYKVARPEGARWSDLRVDDGLRALNNENARADNQLFWRRWKDEDMLRPDGPDPNATAAELGRFHEVRGRPIKIERKPATPAEPPPPPMPATPPAVSTPLPRKEEGPKEERRRAIERRDSQTVLIRDGHIIEGGES
jgi:glycosyltransferase involved in cell wall biosynthesis